MPLRIADHLSLPVETVTQTIGVLAKRRAGKSYLARRLAEQLFKAGQQIVIVDPKGDTWGIRSAADGRGPGLPIMILGGEHGDIQTLEPGSGEVVAKLVVEERVSLLLDLSPFRKHEAATFMTAFLETLYRLKAREQYRTPMMVIVDEADAIAPQRPMRGEERMLGAAEDIVRRGGQRGIGCTLVTQRSAVLNKNVLTQVQVLIALRTIAPQDLEALNAWIDVHGTPGQRKTLMESLPALPVGDAWIWSPGWPTGDGIFQRVHILPIETFDSGATPTGERRVEPKHLAEVDLEALRRQMAATIERAKAEDPRALRRHIAELEREVKTRAPTPAPHVERVEVPVLREQDLRAVADAVRTVSAEGARIRADIEGAFNAGVERIVLAVSPILAAVGRVNVSEMVVKPRNNPCSGKHAAPAQAMEARPVTARRPVVRAGDDERAARLGRGGDARMLTALAQHTDGLTPSQLAILSGFSRRGGTFRTYLGKLRQAGWVSTNNNGQLHVTNAGLRVLGDYDPLPTGPALIDWWRRELGDSGLRAIFDVCVAAYPRTLDLDVVAERAGIARDGGTFRTYVGKLRTLQLLEGRGELRASESLFL